MLKKQFIEFCNIKKKKKEGSNTPTQENFGKVALN